MEEGAKGKVVKTFLQGRMRLLRSSNAESNSKMHRTSVSKRIRWWLWCLYIVIYTHICKGSHPNAMLMERVFIWYFFKNKITRKRVRWCCTGPPQQQQITRTQRSVHGATYHERPCPKPSLLLFCIWFCTSGFSGAPKQEGLLYAYLFVTAS